MSGGNGKGGDLISRMALEALNQSSRDRDAARRLFKEWLRENDDLLEAIAGPAITMAISQAINRDIGAERKEIVRLSRGAPVVTNSVRVGADIVSRPRSACLPQASAEGESRRAARLIHYAGLFALPLPVTNKPLGAAKPWEALEASRYHGKRRNGEGIKEHFYAFIWAACPDHVKPPSEQRDIAEQIDLNTARLLDERAQIAESRKTLEVAP